MIADDEDNMIIIIINSKNIIVTKCDKEKKNLVPLFCFLSMFVPLSVPYLVVLEVMSAVLDTLRRFFIYSKGSGAISTSPMK